MPAPISSVLGWHSSVISLSQTQWQIVEVRCEVRRFDALCAAPPTLRTEEFIWRQAVQRPTFGHDPPETLTRHSTTCNILGTQKQLGKGFFGLAVQFYILLLRARYSIHIIYSLCSSFTVTPASDFLHLERRAPDRLIFYASTHSLPLLINFSINRLMSFKANRQM